MLVPDSPQANGPECWGELGTATETEAAAERKGIDCRLARLESQFRCGGSDAYRRWVVRLLGLEPGGSIPWEPDDRMQLHVARSPQEMEAFLDGRRVNAQYSARMSEGYCWPWSPAPKPGAPLPADVVIGEWACPWNLRGERALSGAPPSALWATDPAGFGQIGCVNTAQGFEYDWSGVIIGPDLVWRGDRWITDRTKSKDPVFKKATSDADVDRLIRNTYKVLLTGGMVGTVAYSTDPESQEAAQAGRREAARPLGLMALRGRRLASGRHSRSRLSQRERDSWLGVRSTSRPRASTTKPRCPSDRRTTSILTQWQPNAFASTGGLAGAVEPHQLQRSYRLVRASLVVPGLATTSLPRGPFFRARPCARNSARMITRPVMFFAVLQEGRWPPGPA